MENNNYSEENLELLERYLKQELNPEAERQIEEELNSSESLREQLLLLQQSHQALQSLVIREKVLAARSRAGNLTNSKQVFFSPRNRFIAVAAVLIPLIAAAVLFSMSDPEHVYSENYLSYQLPINRNTEASENQIEILFQEKKYQALVAAFNDLKPSNKNQKNLFLTSVAALELNEYEWAVQLLEELKKRNSQAEVKLFEQESDFYLALAYIKTDNTLKAKNILQKIRENKRHLYHKNISYWDIWRLSPAY